jgi:hypothetical protein
LRQPALQFAQDDLVALRATVGVGLRRTRFACLDERKKKLHRARLSGGGPIDELFDCCLEFGDAHAVAVLGHRNPLAESRRSSTRATPRGLFGSSGEITDHSKSVKSNRAIPTSMIERLNHSLADSGIPFMRS